jgi:soluble lytic murein transglycosylase-like protein
MFDPEDARNTFNRVADAHRARYPDLQAASDLAAVGLHELSAPLVAEIYEQWKRTRPTAVSFAQWRQIFLYAGDHHHASKATTGLEVGAKTPEQVVDALQLSYPAAYRKEVVYWAKLYDLDPLLILGVMRQESLYQTWAVSSAGAVGLMQVMPITGAKIADALEEPLYSPVSLEDPLVSIRYGSWYLMKLMERFDGIWPMAVASYNTGPTNLSTFYRSFREGGASIDVDDLVEQIPYKETRDYVKRITGHYARYLSLYAPEGAYLYVPLSPAGDHREVVDF